jgi:two-component system, OmpR family, sensor histidine kinase VicK
MFTSADYNFIVKYGQLTPDGVAVFDLNSRKFVYLNRFFTHIFAIEEQALKDDPALILRCIHPDDLSFLDSRYRELLSIGCIADIEFRIKTQDDKTHYLSAEVLWVEDSYTFAIFVKDISRLQEHEEQVLNFSVQKDSLLNVLVHKLSGPLHQVRDILTTMPDKQHNGQSSPKATSLMAIMQQNAEECIGIVNDFLDKQYEASANIYSRSSRFAVQEKINMMLALPRRLNPALKFTVNVSEDSTYVYSDPVKFCQVIQNILSNAIKFTRDNGEITILVTKKEDKCSICMKDDGVGIPESMRTQIFKQQVQGTPSLKGEKPRGMGLFTVKKLMERLGGEVKLISTGDDGTEIALEFPME